ncbi:type VI secretion system protein TssA [Bradyrhizobium cosmicum]|uniref:type VI secretion system protein TssA n=1 Tax=Bradyrhizobium cosmicum TaxID=1404864 RepID=UPI0028E2BA71|nr:type VI secretion system protein TssA [Bradyrhizobium cosmicum]
MRVCVWSCHVVDYWVVVRDNIDARARHGAAPVPGPAPAGMNVRDAAEFEQLEAEVRRMDADGPAAVDWSKVSTLSLHILSNQSKDILVACWASYGLFRTGGYQGLAVGLGVLRGMVDAHWEGLFPPIRRERARVAAIDWLFGRVGPEVAENAPTEADYPAVLAAYEVLDDLDWQLREKLVNEQVALGELLSALQPHYDQAKRVIAAAAERATEAATQAAELAAVAPAVSILPVKSAQSAVVEASLTATSDDDWAGFIDRLPDMLRQATAARRVTSPTDPKVYLFARVGSWMRFDALPPDTGGRTTICPPADNIAALEAKVATGRHADVVNLVEEIVWTAPFWLDTHRHAAKALKQMGPLFEPAAAVVRAGLALLAIRYPRIFELQFNDGRPFADEETRAWVAADGADVSPGRDPVDVAVAEAYRLIGGGQPQAALEKLSHALNGVRGERARFVGQLAQARFCIETGFVTTAIPLLEHMEEVVAERNLESWEPELVLDVAELRFRAMSYSDSQQMIDEPRRRAALEQLRTRVAGIDIARASQLSG